MRKTAVSSLALSVAVVGLSGCGGPAGLGHAQHAAQTINWPKRQAGLWQETLTRGGAAKPAKSALVCLGDGSGVEMAAAHGWGHGDCQRTLTRSRDGAYHFSSACRMAGGTLMTTKGVVSGDFTSHYALAADTQIEDAPIAALDGRRSLKITATYRGPCPTGMKPGKIARADGLRVLASAGG